jgi:hypothetical protein
MIETPRGLGNWDTGRLAAESRRYRTQDRGLPLLRRSCQVPAEGSGVVTAGQERRAVESVGVCPGPSRAIRCAASFRSSS